VLPESLEGDIWQRDVAAARFGLSRLEPHPVGFRFFQCFAHFLTPRSKSTRRSLSAKISPKRMPVKRETMAGAHSRSPFSFSRCRVRREQ
jgi:hypothetical protein